MQGAALLWDELLRHLAAQSRLSLENLLESFVIDLADPDLQHLPTGAGQALQFWLGRIMTASVWEAVVARRRNQLLNLVMETSCLYPSESSREMADLVKSLVAGDAEFAAKWESSFDATFSPSQEDDMDVDIISEHGAQLASESPVDGKAVIAELEDRAGPKGWRVEKTHWSTRPIGVVPAK